MRRIARMSSSQTPATILVNQHGDSRLILICEHAGNFIPSHLNSLGLDAPSLTRHIAWDIGAEGVARALSALLDAPLVLQRWSRLVYDCNRPPSAPDAMPERSEVTEVPGNRRLSMEERAWRIQHLYEPFHDAIAGLLDAAQRRGAEPAVITIHSFTPVYKGQPRGVEVGLLFNADGRLAKKMAEHSHLLPAAAVRLNEPYGPKDGVLHTLTRHAEPRGLLNVMIEIRNDLIATEAEQERWAGRLAEMIRVCLASPGAHGALHRP